MKSINFTLLLLAAVLGIFLPGPLARATERWETLRAINQVENPSNLTRPGPKGELGPYQFRAATWRQYTRQPFALANDRSLADSVAVRHYESIRQRLETAGIAPTTFNIALAWNSGLTAVLQGRIPVVAYRYAERVDNLAATYRAAFPPVPASAPTTAPSRTPRGAMDLPSGAGSLTFRPEPPAVPVFKLVVTDLILPDPGQGPRFVLPPVGPGMADAGTPRVAAAN